MTADTEVLGREEFEADLRRARQGGSRWTSTAVEASNRLLRHDAALRARIESLEAEREELKEHLHSIAHGHGSVEGAKEIARQALEDADE